MSMSTGNPPKGSADWLAEQQGENADAVMGYDTQIATLQDLADKSKPETEEERKKRERKERSKKIMAAVGDGLMALSNLYFTTRGAPNMYNHQAMSQQTPLQKRLEEAKKEREANADKHLQYSLRIGALQNDRAKTLREMEAQQEAQKLAREKAQREQEQHGWLAALQPDKQREQAGKATTAEEKAKTAKAEADNAGEYYKAKVDTERNRGKAAAASATNSYASAAAHNRSNVNEFYAKDEKGRIRSFRTQKAAETFAKQHGTFEDADDKSTRTTESDVTNRGKVVKDENGNPVRTSSTVTATKQGGYPSLSTPRPAYTNTTALGL